MISRLDVAADTREASPKRPRQPSHSPRRRRRCFWYVDALHYRCDLV